jgi:hypothetical protein
VARLLKQPNKPLAELSLGVDNQDISHIKLTFCLPRPFQDCTATALCTGLAERHHSMIAATMRLASMRSSGL